MSTAHAPRRMPLRAALRDRHRRAGPNLGLSLPRLPAADRERLRRPGAIRPGGCLRIEGESREWRRTTDSGNVTVYHFCPECGSTVWYQGGPLPQAIAIPVGAFADPAFPPPRFSVWEKRKHQWVAILGDEVEHGD